MPGQFPASACWLWQSWWSWRRSWSWKTGLDRSLAELEEERRFLLRSLADLEREPDGSCDPTARLDLIDQGADGRGMLVSEVTASVQ